MYAVRGGAHRACMKLSRDISSARCGLESVCLAGNADK